MAQHTAYQFVLLHVDPLQFRAALRQGHHALVADVVALAQVHILQLGAVLAQLGGRERTAQ